MKNELKKSLDWNPILKKLYVDNEIYTGKNAVVRNDTNKLIAVVGKDYEVFSNSQLMELSNSIAAKGQFELLGYDELNEGKTILAFLKNTLPNLKINGCATKEYLIIGTSHDGTRPLYIGTGSSLARCENQFYSTIQILRQKHNAPFNLNDISVKNIINSYNLRKGKIYDSFNSLENVRVDQSVIDKLIKDIHKTLSKDSKQLKPSELGKSPSMLLLQNSIQREMNDLGNNAFGLFNGVTWYTSHEMRNAGADFGKINATANIINQVAFKFCNNLKRAANNEIIVLR